MCTNFVVTGVVTEDSDVFLFGGECVYKNMFDERKYVEVYLAEDAKRELGVSRSEFVCLAHLLGSDYAEGVRGVGIVNAMEILATFGNQRDEVEVEEEKSRCAPEKARGDGDSGGFMSSSAYSRSEAGATGEEAVASSRDRESDVAKARVLREVEDTLEQFKAWLFTGHDFVKTIEELKGGKRTSSSDSDLESVCEKVVKLVSVRYLLHAAHAPFHSQCSSVSGA